MLKWISTILSTLLFLMLLGVAARLLWALLQIGWSLFGLI
jgi:hypothetical protein